MLLIHWYVILFYLIGTLVCGFMIYWFIILLVLSFWDIYLWCVFHKFNGTLVILYWYTIIGTLVQSFFTFCWYTINGAKLWFVESLVHWHVLICWHLSVHWYMLVCWYSVLLVYWFTGSLVHCWNFNFVVHCFGLFFIGTSGPIVYERWFHRYIVSLIHWFTLCVGYWNTDFIGSLSDSLEYLLVHWFKGSAAPDLCRFMAFD